MDRKSALTASAHALAAGIIAWRDGNESLEALLEDAAVGSGACAGSVSVMPEVPTFIGTFAFVETSHALVGVAPHDGSVTVNSGTGVSALNVAPAVTDAAINFLSGATK